MSLITIAIEELSVVFAVAFLYFWFEPELVKLNSRPFISVRAGQLVNLRAFKLKVTKDYALTYFHIVEYLIIIAFFYQVAAIAIQPSIWASHSISDLFLARVNPGENAPNGMHVISGLMAFAIFFVAYGIFKFDAFKAGLLTVFMIFAHESTWYIFYTAKYWDVYAKDLHSYVSDGIFFVTIGGLSLVYLRKYGFKNSKYFLIAVAAHFVYLAWWYFALGFKVTTANNLFVATQGFNMTPYYYDVQTNVVEVFSWILFFSCFVIALYLSKRELSRKSIILDAKPEIQIRSN